LLSRAWQMLLKGLEEVGKAPDPVAAAEMVLIRMAYTADLPSPDEIIKAMCGENAAVRRGTAAPAIPAPDTRATINEAARQAPALSIKAPPQSAKAAAAAPGPVPAGPRPPWEEAAAVADAPRSPQPPPAAPAYASDHEAFQQLVDGASSDDFAEPLIEGLEDSEEEAAPAPAPAALRPIRTFADVVALAGDRRDVRLKIHLEEQVSLVKFDAVNGAIDVFLLPGAPGEIANELREKLNAWTGRRWMVMLSKVRGERTLADVRREREAAELAAIKAHPAVAAIFAEFPGAKIAGIRVVDPERDDETGTG